MADAFSRAATTYDQVAHVQTQVGRRLLAHKPASGAEAHLLDLGCGTGFCTEALVDQAAVVTALDIAPGMLQQARRKVRGNAPDKVQWVCGDAESLPFAPQTFSGAVSNLTVQWSEHLTELFTQLAATLTADGWWLFSTLGPDTLSELRAAWEVVDGYTHVNRFASVTELRKALHEAGFAVELLVEERVVPRYDRAHDLMRELKALGAHNANRQQNRGLTGPRQLRSVAEAYEQFRQADGKLPATYDVIYVLARKR